MQKNKQRGITLIALVVTIIILIILAGVSIQMIVGEDGLITMAKNAKENTGLAEIQEEKGMNELTKDMNNYVPMKVAEARQKGEFFYEDTLLEDDLGNRLKVPNGFKVASDSATKVEDGVVIEDSDGNQYVWIPAKTGEGIIIHTTVGNRRMIYTRVVYSKNIPTEEIDEETNSKKIIHSDTINHYYTQAMSSDEEKSVDANGGYYIGRYEAGDKESTEAKKMRTVTSNQENTITIKKGQAPYNYVTYTNAKKLADNMGTVQEYTTTETKLPSSYAWDTAISLIQIKNNDYGQVSEEGNYKDTTFSYIDVAGTEQIKEIKEPGVVVTTGQTIAVSNIYDLGGNMREYTTEEYSDETLPVTDRGGYFNCNSFDFAAGYRDYNDGTGADKYGMRVALYFKVENE